MDAISKKITIYVLFFSLTILIAFVLFSVTGTTTLSFQIKLDDPQTTAPLYFCISIGSIVIIPMLRRSTECGYWGDMQNDQTCVNSKSAIIGYIILCICQACFIITYILYINIFNAWSIEVVTIIWGILIISGALIGFVLMKR